MARQSLTIEEIQTRLAATPPRLAALTAGVVPAQLQTAPAADAWSATEVLAHLRACADMWGAAIMAILAQDHPTLRAVNPMNWINRTDYRTQAFQPSLHAFAAQRTDLLAVLAPLAPADWARAATVTGAGRVLERTVQLYAQWLAVHERPHIKQVERIVTLLH